jgi:hypothetical protein
VDFQERAGRQDEELRAPLALTRPSPASEIGRYLRSYLRPALQVTLAGGGIFESGMKSKDRGETLICECFTAGCAIGSLLVR